jgi:radical SAM protein with 4Fe4S-binding SPASM domain
MKYPICPRNKMTRKKGYISPELIDKIISETRNKAQFVTLHGWGESILHPKIDMISRKFKDAGFKIQLATNATFLTPDRQAKLLKSGIDFLIFSIDATSEETYNQMRIGGDYKGIICNIETFIKDVKSQNLPITCLCQLIYNKLNVAEAENFRKYWKERGAHVWIKPYNNWNGEDESENYYFPGDIPQVSESLCDWPWRQIVMHWNGNVVPCCCDYDNKVLLGNAYEQSLPQIWNGKAFQEFRKRHLESRKTVEFCRNCSYEPLGTIKQIAFIMLDYLQSLKVQTLMENYFRKKLQSPRN